MEALPLSNGSVTVHGNKSHKSAMSDPAGAFKAAADTSAAVSHVRSLCGRRKVTVTDKTPAEFRMQLYFNEKWSSNLGRHSRLRASDRRQICNIISWLCRVCAV